MLAAVALKVVVAVPAGTMIEDTGTGRIGLLLDKETAAPPAGATWLRVTVHIALVPEVKLVGVHVNEETVSADTRLIVAAWEAPLRVAVSVAF
jgi:hypothetical protein